MGLPDPSNESAALVTGASAGIGTSIAGELASRGHNLVIVARRKKLLNDLASELSGAHGVRVEPLSCDLSSAAARGRLPTRIEKLGLRVDVLVNNAGFATGGPFHESDPEREIQQVRVLIESVVALTAAFLPAMVERGNGAILNVASTAAFQPLPYSAGYSAAKSHALTFSEAIHTEVAGDGVTVTALCPGPVRTDFWEVAGDQPIESAVPDIVWVDADEAAKAGVDGLESGSRVVVPGFPMRAGFTALRWVPHALKLPIAERLMRPRKRD